MRYIAFLRAINVGGHTVKMDRLRQLFEQIGFSNVETFIASGNVIFESKSKTARKLEKQIEAALEQALGYAVDTFLRTPAELAELAAHPAFPMKETTANDALLYIAFLHAAPEAALQRKLMALRNEVDDFHVHGREVYWLRRRALGDSKFTGGVLEKTLGMYATVRNITTVSKLAAKYGE